MLKCSIIGSILFIMKEIITFMTACKLVQCKHMDVHCSIRHFWQR